VDLHAERIEAGVTGEDVLVASAAA